MGEQDVEEAARTRPEPGTGVAVPRGHESSPLSCQGFRLTPQEVVQVLSQSREISYQEWEALPCQVHGRLRSDLEPERDIRFEINVLGTSVISEQGELHPLTCEGVCDGLMVEASTRGG
jgi:hypothetical protein